MSFYNEWFIILFDFIQEEKKMYQITYKNTLKSDKKLIDLQSWLKNYWPVLRTWGAITAKVWTDEEYNKKFVFCRYTVENLDIWNHQAMSLDSMQLVKDLGNVVDLRKQSIKITSYTSYDNQ